LSSLYRLSNLPMKKVDHWLALFVCWDLVKMDIEETKTTYKGTESEDKLGI